MTFDASAVEADLRRWYDRYLSTFIGLARGERDDVDTLIDFFSFPLTRLTAEEISYQPSRADQHAAMSADVRRMREIDYDTSVVDGLSFRVLGPAAATIEGLFTRVARDGSVISSFGTLYLLGKADGDWRITALVAIAR
ncbi:MAG: hypothetical protein AB7L13_10955 [Acidimicrobiia bacterium]